MFEFDSFLSRFIEYIDFLSASYGSGDATLDLILIAGALATALVLLEKEDKLPDLITDLELGSGAAAASVPLDGQPKTDLVPLTQKLDLDQRLGKTSRGILSRLKQVFSGAVLSATELDDLEMALLASDVGPVVAENLLLAVRQELQNAKNGVSLDRLKELLQVKIEEALSIDFTEVGEFERPRVIMIVGVNGAGKTTSVGKLAQHFKDQGKTVLLVAADTFRAAAVEQLQQWGKRVGVEVVAGTDGAKPSGVVYDGMLRARELQPDIVLVDTAGRLHTKTNLMQELGGVRNAIAKQQQSAPHETWLVLDGTSGQNGLTQAREFNEVCPLTGIIVTKLDSTSKGGVVVAVSSEVRVPVRFIGIGEGAKDLKPFLPKEFATALLAETTETVELSEHARVRRRKRPQVAQG